MKRLLNAMLAVARFIIGGTFRLLRGTLGALKPAGKDDLKRRLATVVALLLIAGVGGLLAVASGIVPIKASSGHWPITEWFLHFSMQRSVATHSVGIEPPPLDDPDLVLKGAGHYDTGCFPCHGGPHMQYPRVARAMTPHPPYLPATISQWEPEEIFYIVKHGVKFTGMPAWPTQQRDDEVWAMVAFLQTFTQMDADEYRRLVYGEAPVGEQVAPLQGLTEPEGTPRVIIENCGRCHRANGQGRGSGAFPKLAGQTREYLDASLRAYALGQRNSGIMQPIAAGLTRREIRELSQYYSSLEPAAPRELAESNPQGNIEAVERGAAIANRGVPQRRVPACADCHSLTKEPRKALYPILDGQFANYLVQQIKLFKSRHRGGTDHAHLMHSVVDGLSPEQMRDVATYYESLAAPSDHKGQ